MLSLPAMPPAATAAGEPDPQRLESRIRGSFHGWRPGRHVELDDDQVWRVADDSSALYELQSLKVVVHRGTLAAFYLEIEGVGFQIRAGRVR